MSHSCIGDAICKKSKLVKVSVNINISAYANISALYDKKKEFTFKADRAMKASEKVIDIAVQKSEAAIRKHQNKKTGIEVGRKVHWFERFHWFITREGLLVLSGRDAQQNELLVKRYLRKSHGDLYVHADLHGAATCIIRSNAVGAAISAESLREAGQMTVCRSAAWNAKIITSAWWVHAEQVSKTAPSGEYLPTGSFMIRGKKNFLPRVIVILTVSNRFFQTANDVRFGR